METIISRKLGEKVAIIESISEDKLTIKTKIVENKFPLLLIDLMNDSIEAANELSLALFDDLQNEINSYDFFLKESCISIFNLYINKDILKFNVDESDMSRFINNSETNL